MSACTARRRIVPSIEQDQASRRWGSGFQDEVSRGKQERIGRVIWSSAVAGGCFRGWGLTTSIGRRPLSVGPLPTLTIGRCRSIGGFQFGWPRAGARWEWRLASGFLCGNLQEAPDRSLRRPVLLRPRACSARCVRPPQPAAGLGLGRGRLGLVQDGRSDRVLPDGDARPCLPRGAAGSPDPARQTLAAGRSRVGVAGSPVPCSWPGVSMASSSGGRGSSPWPGVRSVNWSRPSLALAVA